MLRRVLIIAEPTISGSVIRDALSRDATLACESITWDATGAVAAHARTAELVVIIAGCQPLAPLFDLVRRHYAGTPVFAILPPDAGDPLMRLVLQNADDFLMHPAAPGELRHRVTRLLGQRHDVADVSRRLLEEIGLTKLVGEAPAFLQAVEQVPRFARADASVLITGETGTGKELCARAIHHLSGRRQAPFVAVDCGTLPDQLFENELFGHTRGAFTDAHRDQKGLVALANGGTLFLDEVDALSPAAQGKLLRFLQERSFRALGSDRLERADVRVLAATNRHLETCMRAGQLRPDLYFRLNVLRIQLPPLRERRGDIPLLVSSMLQECRAAMGRGPTAFSPAALRVLSTYDWPGNVRELGNVVQRAAVICDGDRVLPTHISLGGDPPAGDPEPAGAFRAARAAALAAFERRYVEDLLRKHNGNVTHAAKEARQDRRAFGRVIKKYQIDRRTLARAGFQEPQ